jgi:hypothetical protein
MLQRFPANLRLTMVGLILVAIAFISISFLPSIVESSLIGQLGGYDITTSNLYRRIYADRFLLQSIYIFLTGTILLIAGLFKPLR